MSSKCQYFKFKLVLKIFSTTASFARLAKTCLSDAFTRSEMFLIPEIEIRSSPSFEIPNPAAFILAVGVVQLTTYSDRGGNFKGSFHKAIFLSNSKRCFQQKPHLSIAPRLGYIFPFPVGLFEPLGPLLHALQFFFTFAVDSLDLMHQIYQALHTSSQCCSALVHTAKVILIKSYDVLFLSNRLVLVGHFRVHENLVLLRSIYFRLIKDARIQFCFINFHLFKITTLCWPKCACFTFQTNRYSSPQDLFTMTLHTTAAMQSSKQHYTG